MGYCHYWRLFEGGIEAWKEREPQVIGDFMALLPHLPPLAGSDGTGRPELGEVVAFNGRAPKEDYESFVFPYVDEKAARARIASEGYVFGSVKTGFTRSEARPYDLAVRAFLILARLHMGRVLEVSTDGWLEDWVLAARLVEEVLALPVDLYQVLNDRLYLVQTGDGREFLYESEEGPQSVEEYLEKVKRYSKKWPYRGPYRVLREVRVPQDELPGLRMSVAGYTLYRVPEEV